MINGRSRRAKPFSIASKKDKARLELEEALTLAGLLYWVIRP